MKYSTVFQFELEFVSEQQPLCNIHVICFKNSVRIFLGTQEIEELVSEQNNMEKIPNFIAVSTDLALMYEIWSTKCPSDR